jgi:hypothetical protein
MNQFDNEYSVVMTACIDPSGGSIKIHRSDPSIRLKDYINGLHFWLNIADQRLNKIVFIENSGYPLDAIQDVFSVSNPLRKQVEFISLCCNNYPEEVHYGYAELNMLDEAFTISKILNKSSYFIKATGRLAFPNIPHLLNLLPENYLFSVDCRNNSLFTRSPQVFVTTQLMLFSTSFYRQYLLDAKSGLNREISHIETLLYYKLLSFKDKEGAMLRWPVNVDPVGYAAGWHTEKKYNSPKQNATNFVRAICRGVFPNWWV